MVRGCLSARSTTVGALVCMVVGAYRAVGCHASATVTRAGYGQNGGAGVLIRVSAWRGPPGRDPFAALNRWLRWRLRCADGRRGGDHHRSRAAAAVEHGGQAAHCWETHERGVRVCHVAARHGLCESLLFAWRRQVREGLLVEPDLPVFMPVQMLGTVAAVPSPPSPAPVGAPVRPQASLIEIELGDGRQVRVGADVNQAALRRVLTAVRR